MAPGARVTLDELRESLARDVAHGPIADGFGEYLRLTRMVGATNCIRNDPSVKADAASLAEAEKAYEEASAAYTEFMSAKDDGSPIPEPATKIVEPRGRRGRKAAEAVFALVAAAVLIAVLVLVAVFLVDVVGYGDRGDVPMCQKSDGNNEVVWEPCE